MAWVAAVGLVACGGTGEAEWPPLQKKWFDRAQVSFRGLDFDDAELLRPGRLYERHGRMQEYTDLIERLKAERVARLEEFPELTPEIVKAAG